METRAINQPPQAAITGIKFLIGAFVTALGVLLTLDNLDVIQSDRYLAWWPMVLVAIGMVKISFDSGRIFGAVLFVGGLLMTAFNVGLIPFSLFDLWPLILIVGGCGLVARAFGWKPAVPAIPQSTSLALLAGRTIEETTRDYGGRRYIAFMGSHEIDLTAAEIQRGAAAIETVAVWGSIEIVVPDGWEIVGEVIPVMGAFEAKVRQSDAPRRQLIVRGAAVMGSVEIKSAPARKS